MKICVVGLDGASPEMFFQDERLVNIRRLMELGAYGALQGVLPPGPVPGWICLAAGQDPGSLGIYGSQSRSLNSYSLTADGAAPGVTAPFIWDYLAAKGKKSILISVPPGAPPRQVDGISVALPAPETGDFAFPAGIQDEIHKLVGEYSAGVQLSPHQSKETLRSQIFEMSRKRWEVARWLLREKEWGYFHLVDVGLNRVQRAFWEFHDPAHPRYEPGNSYQHVIAEYCLWLDEQIGSLLELLDADSAILLASTGGMQRVDGAFAMNQWLLQKGLLALKQPGSAGVTPFDQLDMDWGRTRAWAGEGPLAPIYFNIRGREPQGIIPAEDGEPFAGQLTAKLQAFFASRRLAVQAFKPSQIYRQLHNAAPDLIVQLGEGRCPSVAGVGYPDVYISKVADGCTPTTSGMFVLTAPNCPLSGKHEGANLLDMAPTLLDLAGHEIPNAMQGRSLLAGMEKKSSGTPEEEQIILDRLAGLGYI